MLVYRADAKAEEAFADATPEQLQAGMAAWMAWHDKVGPENIDFGLPLQPRVHVASDGTASESTSDLSGYSVLTADSVDAAVALVADHPHLAWRGGSIEILELLPMPGA